MMMNLFDDTGGTLSRVHDSIRIDHTSEDFNTIVNNSNGYDIRLSNVNSTDSERPETISCPNNERENVLINSDNSYILL